MSKDSKLITILVILYAFLVFSLTVTVSAEEASLGAWVLKETPSRTVMCEERNSCFSPNVVVTDSTVYITYFAKEGECDAQYNSKAAWNVPPTELKPGESMISTLSLSASQSTDCPGGEPIIGVTLYMGKSELLGDWAGSWEIMERVEIRGWLKKGKDLTDTRAITWKVPSGSDGEELHVKFASGFSTLPAGDKTFLYEYKSNNLSSDNAKKEKKSSPVSCSAFFKSGSADSSGIKLKSDDLLNLITIIPAAYARDSGARFADFSGEVAVAPGLDPKDAQPAELNMVLEVGSIITTESDSSAIISFADMTTFCMQSFSKVILDTPPEKDSKLQLLTGKILLNVEKMIKDGTLSVTMNQAVAGIKATTLVLEETENQSVLKVVQGEVEFTSLATGEKQMVRTGEMLVANSSGLSKIDWFDLEEEKKSWENLESGENKSKSWTRFFWVLVIGVLALFAVGYFFAKKKK
ncbi:hypothetical protein C4573_03255 [Candidatus Woesearchaeota archaeon]|nr:MAG: hypothetical protein C4573_03255 [Candidatus Woesearchaeota archaeon]